MVVYLIGTGMGDGKTLTREALEALENADIFIGAKRMIQSVNTYGKPVFISYNPHEIKEILKSNCDCASAAILLSGDISFYSGAKKLNEVLSDYEVIRISGISSFSYMCGKLGIPMNDTEEMSMHGKENSIICRVRDNRFVFTLLNNGCDIKHICGKLNEYGMGECILHIGSMLGYRDERIILCKANECDGDFESPVSLIIENNTPKNLLGKHLEDTEFIRGDVPMTKSAVRSVSISALNPDTDSIIYDIGAGTGSVSVELSLKSHDITVYAVERKHDAVEIIRQNCHKFGADNVKIIEGYAPSSLEQLPPPTHVFIGGSGGNMHEIISSVLDKNKDVKIVLNTIALNSSSEVLSIANELNLDIEVMNVSVSSSKKVGGLLMMTGQNPINVFVLKRGEGDG